MTGCEMTLKRETDRERERGGRREVMRREEGVRKDERRRDGGGRRRRIKLSRWESQKQKKLITSNCGGGERCRTDGVC